MCTSLATLFAFYGLVLLFAISRTICFLYVCAGQGCVMLKILSWISIYLCCDMCYVLILCRYPCLSYLCHACFPKILDEFLISQICVLCIQKQILQVHTLWGSSSNIFHGNICLKLIIISFLTLARFVIVNPKEGDCKCILPLTIILANDDTGAKV